MNELTIMNQQDRIEYKLNIINEKLDIIFDAVDFKTINNMNEFKILKKDWGEIFKKV